MTKMLYIMSSVPGSGKSTLAKKLAEENNGVIFSADDFFMVNGEYKWSGNFINGAHQWCFGNFAKAVFNNVECIIIDNTNLQKWQVAPYVELASKNGYDFEVVEPKTKWKHDAEECAKRNTHGVPQATIERMLKEREDPKKFASELRAKYYKA